MESKNTNRFSPDMTPEAAYAFQNCCCLQGHFINTRMGGIKQVYVTQTLSSAIESLLHRLSTREAQVLKLRYGLEDGRARTLEEVGKKFGVTRERIRQIGTKALNQLHHLVRGEYLEEISSPFETLFRGAGGVLKETAICDRLPEVASIGEFHPSGLFRLVLLLSPQKFKRIEDKVWALADYPLEHISTIMAESVRILERRKARIRFDALVSEIKCNLATVEATPLLDGLFIEACIQANPSLKITRDEWCSLIKWRARYTDEIIEVFRTESKPLHYSVVARQVNNLLADKQIVEHNVHALLQRKKDIFVRVGQGTYALVEWGMKPPIH